jgi:DNA-directed RNA polymerase specialized sigma24 family protein
VPDSADDAFAGLGPGDRDDLLRLAVLLVDDRSEAADLARAALLAVASRRRRAGDAASTARTELVRRALRTSGRGGRADSWVTDDPAAPYDDGYAGLRAALAGLPPRTRAAVVLSRWVGLSDAEIGAVLRCPAASVRTEVAQGSAVLRPALPSVVDFRRPLDAPVTAEPDQELHDVLGDLAHAGASSAAALPAGAELRGELSRRRRWLAAVAAGCGAVLVAVVALAGSWSPGEGAVAERTETSRPTATTSAPTVDVTDLPPRGSLAGDADFLAGLLELSWTEAEQLYYPTEVTTAPETRRVLFAGDVPGGRWALLVGRPELVDPAAVPPDQPRPVLDDLFMAWFAGPPGAAPEEMELISYPYGLAPGYLPSLHDPRTGTLVVVAAPGDTVEVSPGVDIDAAGEDSRTWTPVEMEDGVAVTQLEPTDLPWTWAVSYRVHRDGQEWLTAPPDGVLVPPDEQVLDLDVAYPVPPTDEARLATQYAVLAALAPLGVSLDDVDITVHALAPVPAPAGGVIAVASVTLPSGAVLISAQWTRDGPDGYPVGSDCGVEVRPAGRAPEDGVLAARCELYDPVSGQSLAETLLVVAPPSVAVVRVYRGDDTFVAEHAVPDGGVLIVPAPEGTAEIEAVTDTGVLLGRVRPLDRWVPPR